MGPTFNTAEALGHISRSYRIHRCLSRVHRRNSRCSKRRNRKAQKESEHPMTDYKELVERLRHECAAFGDHSYDGCECSNEELLASAITDLQGKLKATHDAKQAALDIATVARQDLSRLKDLLGSRRPALSPPPSGRCCRRRRSDAMGLARAAPARVGSAHDRDHLHAARGAGRRHRQVGACLLRRPRLPSPQRGYRQKTSTPACGRRSRLT